MLHLLDVVTVWGVGFTIPFFLTILFIMNREGKKITE